jgi:dCMP deaminase
MLYLPVIHRGYERLIEEHAARGSEVLLLGAGFARRYPVVRKSIRALQPHRLVAYLHAIEETLRVSVVEPDDLPARVTGPVLVVPDEDLMRQVVADYGLGERATVVHERTFLRWDRSSSLAAEPRDGPVVANSALVARFATLARDLGAFSPDWWRQVGAVAVRGEEVIGRAHNTHLPTEYHLYAHGDPRDSHRKLEGMDLVTSLHAEAAVIAAAARDGVSLRGADLYVSTFPCPTCARLVAAAGFGRCFFVEGYSTLAGAEVLTGAGVELLAVDVEAIGS